MQVGEELLHVRGDAHDTGGRFVSAPEQGVVPDPPCVKPTQFLPPGRRSFLAEEAGGRLETTSDGTDDQWDAEAGGRGGVTHRDRDDLVRDIELLAHASRCLIHRRARR